MQEAFEVFASLGGNQEDVEMLKKYQNISKFASMGKRKEFFVNSSSAEKSDSWKVHLAYSIVKFPELNKEQKEIILDLISLVKPELYDIEKDSEEWQVKVEKPIQMLSNRALEAFSKEVGLQIFLKLGGETSSTLFSGDKISRRAQCDCSQGSIPACWYEYCVNSLCVASDSGCGVLWVSRCNGSC